MGVRHFYKGDRVRYHGTDVVLKGLTGTVCDGKPTGEIVVMWDGRGTERWAMLPSTLSHAATGIDGAWDKKPNEPHGVPPYDKELPQVAHGGKDDKGKPNPALLFEGCGAALAEVCKVLDGGAKKYSANSWQQVPNGIERYKAAFYRHLQDMQVHGWDAVNTADFGLLHIDHAITDLLFIRSLMLKQKETSNAV